VPLLLSSSATSNSYTTALPAAAADSANGATHTWFTTQGHAAPLASGGAGSANDDGGATQAPLNAGSRRGMSAQRCTEHCATVTLLRMPGSATVSRIARAHSDGDAVRSWRATRCQSLSPPTAVAHTQSHMGEIALRMQRPCDCDSTALHDSAHCVALHVPTEPGAQVSVGAHAKCEPGRNAAPTSITPVPPGGSRVVAAAGGASSASSVGSASGSAPELVSSATGAHWAHAAGHCDLATKQLSGDGAVAVAVALQSTANG